jgi:hypothetical protein
MPKSVQNTKVTRIGGSKKIRKFKVGDMVSYQPSSGHSRDAPRGAYQVMRLMPADETGVATYRIRNLQEDYERVGSEPELSKL